MPAAPVILLALVAAASVDPVPPPASPAAAGPAEPPRVFFAEPRIATVVGERQADVSFAMAHLSALDRYLEYVLGAMPAQGSGARVEVADVPGAPDIQARAAAGQMLIVVRPGALSPFSDRCAEAAARAWAGRVSLSAGVPPAAEGWFLQALAAETLVQLRPALADLWLREASVSPAPAYADLAAGKSSLSEAFLLWRCVREELTSTESAAVAIDFARGRSLAVLLAARNRSPESWWPMTRAGLVLSRPPVSLGMRESSDALDDIASFVFDLGAGDAVHVGPDIVPHRRLAAVRQGVEARLRALRREIIRQNPVFHNAWRAFGLWLEKFQDAEPAELAALWRDFERERAEARALRAEIEAALKGAGG
ncbi:MAG: hypothetical protein ACO3ND_04410 [Opitutales bacterium]